MHSNWCRQFTNLNSIFIKYIILRKKYNKKSVAYYTATVFQWTLYPLYHHYVSLSASLSYFWSIKIMFNLADFSRKVTQSTKKTYQFSYFTSNMIMIYSRGGNAKNNKKNLYNSTNTYNFYIYIKNENKKYPDKYLHAKWKEKIKENKSDEKMEMMTMIWFKRKYGT